MNKPIAFIGLGQMGMPMARNLLQAGFSTWVYNRSPEKTKVLIQEGAQVLNHPKDALENSSIVITMLANDKALEEVVFSPNGLGSALKEGVIHLSMSTISPETSRKLADFHKERGAHYLAAPVFGRPEAAAAKKLWICLAGEAEAKELVKPILDVLGQGVFDLGNDPGQANVAKLAGNFAILSAIESMAEALTFAEKNGVKREILMTLLSETLFNCPIYKNYGKLVAAHQYEPAGFKMELGLKDLNLLLSTADLSQTPMPLAFLLHGRLVASLSRGRGHLDWSGIALMATEEAGLKRISDQNSS